ncbi:nitrile hydratase accessory protein [Kribbella sp. NPDC049227]|uniref:nitrile hydratase accessory protein n=1 Tax=Kribbella sp. NPDC049227 TaxID=3364113 RepID=UPI003717B319
MTADSLEDTVTGLPRSNGELVFAQPWESRAFGIAAALADQGLFSWKDFQQNLIAEVSRREAEPGEYSYYDRWLGALEALLSERGVVSADDIDARADVLCHRPAGHDHRDDGHGDHTH